LYKNNWYLFLVTTDKKINELEEFLVTVQEDNYESQLVSDDKFTSQNHSQEAPITSPIGSSKSMPKKQSKHFSLLI